MQSDNIRRATNLNSNVLKSLKIRKSINTKEQRVNDKKLNDIKIKASVSTINFQYFFLI